MKLLLTSAGFRKDNQSPYRTEIVDGFKKLLGKDPKGLNCAYIPTAADPEVDKWFVDAGRQELLDLGMDIVETDLKEDKEVIRRKLEDADVIYMNGGNTFYLLDWVRKSGLDKYLRGLLDQGKVYVGVSAGSIIVGPSIEVAGWGPTGDPNTINLQDLAGLNLVPFAISPHFTEPEREVLEENLKHIDYKIIPITDAQAMLVENEDWQLIGQGEQIIIT